MQTVTCAHKQAKCKHISTCAHVLYTQIQIHIQVVIQVYSTCACAYMLLYIHTHKHKQTCTHIHAHIFVHRCIFSSTRAHTRVYMCRHNMCTHMLLIYTCIHICIPMTTNSKMHAHMLGVYPSTHSKESDRHTEHSEDSAYMGPFLVLEPLARFQDRGGDCVSGSKPVLLWGTC